jgi:ribonuclease D
MSASAIKIEFIQTNEALQNTATYLSTKSSFAFDTEFDRFWREYGFKLLLIQIYDGEKCFLLDPISITNFKPLWDVFENENICKIAYACSEDIQLLKMNGCNTRNIFDVQIAAKLCNHPGNSFGDLVMDICKTTIDKSMQRSNWRTRPLSMQQQEYASNDVIWLPQLKAHFDNSIEKNEIAAILQAENKACENIPIAVYEVKITPKQKARYNSYFKNIILQLLVLRDKAAEEYNQPPFMIYSDAKLEEIVENPTEFLAAPFEKGFSSKFRFNKTYANQFVEIIKSIDTTKPFEAIKKERPVSTEKKNYYNPDKEAIENNYKKIHGLLTEKHGIIAGEFIIRGLKKALQAKPYHEISLKPYQLEKINEACKVLGVEL